MWCVHDAAAGLSTVEVGKVLVAALTGRPADFRLSLALVETDAMFLSGPPRGTAADVDLGDRTLPFWGKDIKGSARILCASQLGLAPEW
jgi:hypothetical protein